MTWIFSNNLRKVILIELTWPCEENVKPSHSTKIKKYLPLKTIIESIGWCVKPFAVEIGAMGYCSKSVLCSFEKLGFNNTLIRNSIKNFSKSSLEYSWLSGCIWLARNSKDRTPSAANCKLNDPSKETCNSPSSLCSLKQTIRPVSNAKLIPPVGFIIKGSTSYANSILQVLSVVPNLWNRVPSESNTLSPMLRAISLNMAVKKNSTKPVDPSNFLWALKRKLSIIRGVPFDFYTQQDVVKILQIVLDQLKGISIAASHLIYNTQNITVSSNTCFCLTVSEENLDIVTLPVSADIQTSMDQFLKPEILSLQTKWFFPWSCLFIFFLKASEKPVL